MRPAPVGNMPHTLIVSIPVNEYSWHSKHHDYDFFFEKKRYNFDKTAITEQNFVKTFSIIIIIMKCCPGNMPKYWEKYVSLTWEIFRIYWDKTPLIYKYKQL